MSKYNFPEDDSDTDVVIGIRRQLERQQRASQLGQSSIPGGSSGSALPVSQLAYGEQTQTTAALFSCAGNAIWRSDPLEPILTVVVKTGRLRVGIAAIEYSSLSSSNVTMSWQILDSSGFVVIGPDQFRALVTATSGFAAAAFQSGSYRFLHTGLTPGATYQVQVAYRNDKYGGPDDTSFFQNRTLEVQPY